MQSYQITNGIFHRTRSKIVICLFFFLKQILHIKKKRLNSFEAYLKSNVIFPSYIKDCEICCARMLSCFSHVQLFATLWSPPGSSVHGIFQARIMDWVAIPSARGSSGPRDRTWVFYISCIGRQLLYH